MASQESKARDQLLAGSNEIGLDIDDQRATQLLEHLELVRKWSGAYNLVSPRDLEQLVTRHLLDSLSIQQFITAGPMLDVGAGAGFPGLPLAIINPEMETTLVDSAGKKIRFLRHVVRTLGLENVRPEHARIKGFSPGTDFSTITSRAYGSLRVFAEAVRHIAGPETRLLAMKGKAPQQELDDLPGWLSAEPPRRLQAQGAERHLVIMSITS